MIRFVGGGVREKCEQLFKANLELELERLEASNAFSRKLGVKARLNEQAMVSANQPNRPAQILDRQTI